MATSGGAIEREGARSREVTRTGAASRAVTALRGVPKPLAVLLAIALIEGIVWCIALPPLQGPDEISHIAYVQAIAETGSIPWHKSEPANPGNPYSTELRLANLCSGLEGLAQNLSARAPASTVDEGACLMDLEHLPPGDRTDGGFTSADKNPPLYYLYETLPYLAFHHSTFFSRSLAMRLANLPAMLALVLFTWLLAGELLLGLPRGPALRVLASVAVALNPQLTMMTATVNPDLLLAAFWTAGLWLSVSIVRHGATRARVVWLAAVCVLAAFTQGRGLPLIPVAAPRARDRAVAAPPSGPATRPGPGSGRAWPCSSSVHICSFATRSGGSDGEPGGRFPVLPVAVLPAQIGHSWKRRSIPATESARCSWNGSSARSPSSSSRSRPPR